MVEADIFRALSDPTRRAVYERLAGGELNVAALKAGFEISQPAVSQHLKVLRNSRLVRAEPKGASNVYHIDPHGLGQMRAWLDRFWSKTLAAYKDKLACFTVSLDTPFAQKRFCTDQDISNMQSLSDQHDRSFGTNYGVLIEGLPIPLLSRAVFVVDRTGKITYAEYVPEVTSHPNYDAALAAVKAVVA